MAAESPFSNAKAKNVPFMASRFGKPKDRGDECAADHGFLWRFHDLLVIFARYAVADRTSPISLLRSVCRAEFRTRFVDGVARSRIGRKARLIGAGNKKTAKASRPSLFCVFII